MKVARKPEAVAAELSVPERILLFCIASGTDWQRAGVTGETGARSRPSNLVANYSDSTRSQIERMAAPLCASHRRAAWNPAPEC
jgi:hypothetical protein